MNNTEKTDMSSLVKDPVVGAVRRLACALPSSGSVHSSTRVWLVGGAIRDYLLSGSRVPGDYDFSVTCDPARLAKAVAKDFGAGLFPLDKERGIYRVVSGNILTIDIGPLKDDDIEKDLLQRDFTVDAMAVDIMALGELDGDGGIVTNEVLIDPTGGVKDALALRLRPVGEGVFDLDPIRTLRAVRLAALMKLEIAPETRKLIREKAALLTTVAPERIRDEFLCIFASPLALRGVRLLIDLDLTDKIFPALASVEAPGVWSANNAMRRLQKAEIFLDEIKVSNGPFGRLYDYFTGVTGPASNFALLRLSVFFSEVSREGIGPDGGRFGGTERKGEEGASTAYEAGVREDLKRLCLGSKATSAILSALKFRHGVFRLMGLERITDRARHRFFDAAGGSAGLIAATFAIACEGSSFIDVDSGFEVFVRTMVDYYFDDYLDSPLPPLLSGGEMMEIFSVGEGSAVGALCSALSFAESEGIVDTRDEAIKYIEDCIEQGTS